MRYITMDALAERWNASVQTVLSQLEAGHVRGAVCLDEKWFIPEDAPSLDECCYQAFMPIWRRFVSGESSRMIEETQDEQERSIALAGQYYFQSRYQEACQEAEKSLNSPIPEIRASALLLHCMVNVPLGDIAASREDMRVLAQEKAKAQNTRMRVVHDYIEFLMGVFFHHDDDAEPSFSPEFSKLPMGVRLYGLYAYAHALYLSKDYHRALGVAESALAVAEDDYPCVCMYLYLAAAMAAMNLSMLSLADSFFQKAWKLAEPENYIQPFVEHHGLLQGQVEKYFRDRSPEHYQRISEGVLLFSRGWMKVHNPESVNKVTDQLTPFEFALAMMAAKGKSNQEIAEYQNISVSTVKFYLSSIYQKLGVSGRGDLEKYLNR